jgi:acetylornithine deacetylase/succinyl-diaminopimelate desuccinylase-like protein
LFSSILAIKACQENQLKHPRCVITIEGSEEGEIDDLIYYLNKYKDLLGNPTLVICLDAGGCSKDTLSITSSLRGCYNFNLKAKIAENSMHSGISGGVAPNPFHILTTIIGKICDPLTQKVVEPFHVEIPEHRLKECRDVANKLPLYSSSLPLLPNVKTLAYS